MSLKVYYKLVVGIEGRDIAKNCSSLEEAKLIRDNLIDLLKANADTRQVTKEIFGVYARITSVKKNILKVQVIESEVEE